MSCKVPLFLISPCSTRTTTPCTPPQCLSVSLSLRCIRSSFRSALTIVRFLPPQGVGELLLLFQQVLLEQRVVLRSSSALVLTACCEALVILLFPLVWQHGYETALSKSSDLTADRMRVWWWCVVGVSCVVGTAWVDCFLLF